MKITSATFHACVTGLESLPPEKLPIIALVGRSNVGKSSLINTLVGRREMAKTSSRPGKTLTINFYLINEQFFLVDLPGYGYAKASRVTRQRIQKMMDEFFQGCTEIKGLVQIIDSRHPPTTLDKQMYAWIRERGYQYLPVLTKVDKLSQQQAHRMKRNAQQELGLGNIVMFSAKTGQGREELLAAIESLLEGRAFKAPVKAMTSARNQISAKSRIKRQNVGEHRNATEQNYETMKNESINNHSPEQRPDNDARIEHMQEETHSTKPLPDT